MVEKSKGFQIFARSSFDRGYQLTDAYDISQTQGREMPQVAVRPGSPEMEKAMETVLNYAAAPVVLDEDLDVPAFYDQDRLELARKPLPPLRRRWPTPGSTTRGGIPIMTGRRAIWTPRACLTSCANGTASGGRRRTYPT